MQYAVFPTQLIKWLLDSLNFDLHYSLIIVNFELKHFFYIILLLTQQGRTGNSTIYYAIKAAESCIFANIT